MAKKILIVEDNEINMKFLHELLHTHDYETIESVDGCGVLEISRSQMPDLIVMDIQLPERSGLDITKDLKADDRLKHIPVIAVTAFAMKGDEEKIRAAGCDEYISKPVDIILLLDTINKHLL